MHVGVDATCWLNNRGYGRHARSLVRALVEADTDNRYTLFLDGAVDETTLPPRAEIRNAQTSRPTAEAASANGRRSLRDMWRMGRALADPRLDVLLFPSIYSYVPVFSRSKKVVVIHDVIAEQHARLTHPRLLPRLFWKTKVALGRRQADALVTVSEHSRRGIVRQFGTAPERVFVVGEASDPVFRVLDDVGPTPALRQRGIDGEGRWIVYVGGFSPHKNLGVLIDALARLAERDEFADVRLAMVGAINGEAFHSYYGEIERQVRALGLAGRVVFTDYLPDEELVVLLNLATTLVLPSLLEGFGLPAVEAAACGLPVIATTESPLPDLLGTGGVFVRPEDADGWHKSLARVLGSPDQRMEMRRCGLEAADKLTWAAAARQMMEVLRTVAA